jgi:molecular chaperone GrpE
MTEENFSEEASEQLDEAIRSEKMVAEGNPNTEPAATDLIDKELAELIEDAATITKEEELLADLQRLQAEFVNYKNRVERDRDLARNAAIAEVLRAVLPALDDLERAESHGDLEGSPFVAVVTKLRSAGEKFGLTPFGKVGDKFDPEIHNALVQTPNPDVTETVISDVVELGFNLGDRLLRPALVAVFIPEEK